MAESKNTPEEEMMGEKGAILPIDCHEGLKRVMGDRELFEELVLEFMESLAPEAEALGEALGKGDADTVTKRAHSVKGAAANLGAKGVAEAAFRLEQMGRQGSLDGGEQALRDLEQRIDELKAYISQPDWLDQGLAE